MEQYNNYKTKFAENIIICLKDCPRDYCPRGYCPLSGRVGGLGNIGERSITSVPNSVTCGEHCDATDGCCSFEWSPTEKRCNLNKECFPLIPPIKDYLFFAKSGAVKKIKTRHINSVWVYPTY